MSDTLDNTFDLFFNDDYLNERKCLDCDATNDLHVLYTTEQGKQAWICPACEAKRTEQARQRSARERNRIAEMEARDRWEE